MLPIASYALSQSVPDATSELTCDGLSQDGYFYYGQTIQCSVYCKNLYKPYTYVVAEEGSLIWASESLDADQTSNLVAPDPMNPESKFGWFRNQSIGANGKMVYFNFITPTSGKAGVMRVRAANMPADSLPEQTELRGSPIMFKLRSPPGDLLNHESSFASFDNPEFIVILGLFGLVGLGIAIAMWFAYREYRSKRRSVEARLERDQEWIHSVGHLGHNVNQYRAF